MGDRALGMGGLDPQDEASDEREESHDLTAGNAVILSAGVEV
jgi:hypothetical protein